MARPKKEVAESIEEIIVEKHIEETIVAPTEKKAVSATPKTQERFALNGKTNKVYKSSDFKSIQAFEAFLKPRYVKELDVVNGEPIIKISDKETYFKAKELELEAREKELTDRAKALEAKFNS